MTASMVDGDEKGKRQMQETCLMFIQKGRLKTCISSFQTTFNPSVSIIFRLSRPAIGGP